MQFCQNHRDHSSSYSGVVNLKLQLTHFTLKKLNIIVNEFWAKISHSIATIEVVHEDKAYPEDVRELAVLAASKVYYHLDRLDSYEDSLNYALGAGKLFVTSTDHNTCIINHVRSENVEKSVKTYLIYCEYIIHWNCLIQHKIKVCSKSLGLPSQSELVKKKHFTQKIIHPPLCVRAGWG